jgi:predicted nuclease of predicted toxin-antitoxin system
MSLRFFSDQCVPSEITGHLKQHGHSVTLLREILPINSPDPIVIGKTQELEAILLSLNGDFSDIVAYPPSAYGGIVAVQLHNHPETIPVLMKRLVDFLDANSEQKFYHGKLLVVEAHRIRIREG